MIDRHPSRIPICLASLLCALASAWAPGAEPPPLPPEVVQGAGLEKLTEAEREVLYRWIRERVPQTAPVAAAAAPAPAAPVAATAAPVAATAAAPGPEAGFFDWGPDVHIETRIVSKFDGWTGRTMFEMENGQVWQQRMDGRYQYRGRDTRVVIKRGMFGLHRMTLVDTGRWIGVKQVR